MEELKSYFDEVSKKLKAKEISFQDVLEQMRFALGAAQEAGLFSSQGAQAQSAAAPEKYLLYGRLMHVFGLSNKLTHKHALEAELAQAPWQAMGPAAPVIGVPWSINPRLPRNTPEIKIQEDMTPMDVNSIGWSCARLVDWLAIATFLGVWRRTMGKHTGTIVQFTCSKAGQQGKQMQPMGPHLILAVCNVMAHQLQDQASKWDDAQGPSASQLERMARWCGRIGLAAAARPAHTFFLCEFAMQDEVV